MMSPRTWMSLVVAALVLAACGDVRESLGLGRNPPDEFAVVDRPPLSMPPDFGLRPPKPGALRPQDVNLTQRANDTLFSADNDSSAPTKNALDNPSDIEQALLDQTGSSKADPGIRAIVDRESAQTVVTSKHLVDELLWWKKDNKDASVVVDAEAEATRIKEAQNKGEPVNQGATPIIEHQKSGWLGL